MLNRDQQQAIAALENIRRQLVKDSKTYGPALLDKFDQAVADGMRSYNMKLRGLGDLNTTIPDITIDFTPTNTSSSLGNGLVNVINSVGNVFTSATNAVLGPLSTFYQAQATIKELQAKANQQIITIPKIIGDVNPLSGLYNANTSFNLSNPLILIGGGAILLLLFLRK